MDMNTNLEEGKDTPTINLKKATIVGAIIAAICCALPLILAVVSVVGITFSVSSVGALEMGGLAVALIAGLVGWTMWRSRQGKAVC